MAVTIYVPQSERKIQICGALELEVRKNGILIHKERQKNLITNNGLDNIAELILRTPGRGPSAIAAGTDDGAILALAVTNTGLGAENFRDVINRRILLSKKARMQMLMQTGEGNGVDYKEAGLFTNNVADDADMYSRVFHSTITKTSSIQITYTWEITVS